MRDQEIAIWQTCRKKKQTLFHFLHYKRSLETKLVICNIVNVSLLSS